MSSKRIALFEAIPFVILEHNEVEQDGKKYMTVRGIAQRADEKNGNGRIYPDKILKREVTRLSERLAKNESIFAQADHPSDGVSRLTDTAAMVTGTEYTPQKEAVTTFKVLPTSTGKDLAEIIRAGGKVGISARGYGTLKTGEVNGVKGDVIQEDYSLVTWDFVIGQSTPGAVVSSFEEQARIGHAEGDEMDIKDLTLDALRKDRPELIAALEKELTVKVEAAVAAKVESLVAYKTKDIESKFEARLAEAMKKKKATAADDKEDEKDNGDDEKNEQIEALRAQAAALGLTIAPKESVTAKLETKVATLDKQLQETQTNLVEARRALDNLTEGEKSVAITNFILEKTKGERFRLPIVERLMRDGKPIPKTVEEATTMIEAEKKQIERLLNESTAQGKGHAITNEEPGSPVFNEQKKVKLANGLEITEQQARQRELAGVR